MDSYGKYLRDAQVKYFTDVILKAAPEAKVTVKDTYWQHDQSLPFHIVADVTLSANKKYEAIMEYRNWGIKGADTNYGMIVIDMYGKYDENDNCEQLQVYVNPATLRSTLNAPEKDDDEFFKELAYWAENFTSERYTSPKDGKTIPDLRDVVLTYAQNSNTK